MYSIDISKWISCTKFGRMKQSHGWLTPDLKWHTRNVFVFLLHGQAEFTVEDRKYHLHAGDIVIIPTGMMYKTHTSDSCEYYFFHFDGEIHTEKFHKMPAMSRDFSFELPPHVTDFIHFPEYIRTEHESVHFYNRIIACTEYIARGTHAGRRLLDLEFQKILLTLADLTEAQHQSNALPAALSRLIVYIKKNLTKHMSSMEICANCHISTAYAGRLFKKHLHTTITEYVNNEKLYYACELIRNTGMNLSEIADYLGYCDVFYFSKRFKQKFGKSPTQMFPRKK